MVKQNFDASVHVVYSVGPMLLCKENTVRGIVATRTVVDNSLPQKIIVVFSQLSAVVVVSVCVYYSTYCSYSYIGL